MPSGCLNWCSPRGAGLPKKILWSVSVWCLSTKWSHLCWKYMYIARGIRASRERTVCFVKRKVLLVQQCRVSATFWRDLIDWRFKSLSNVSLQGGTFHKIAGTGHFRLCQNAVFIEYKTFLQCHRKQMKHAQSFITSRGRKKMYPRQYGWGHINKEKKRNRDVQERR